MEEPNFKRFLGERGILTEYVVNFLEEPSRVMNPDCWRDTGDPVWLLTGAPFGHCDLGKRLDLYEADWYHLVRAAQLRNHSVEIGMPLFDRLGMVLFMAALEENDGQA